MKPWTRILDDLADSAKVFTVARVLQVKPAAAFGCMVRWLTWVDAHCSTPQTGLTVADMECVCFGMRGVYEALVAIGWVVCDEFGCVVVQDYDKYLSPTSKERAKNTERVNRHRKQKKSALRKGASNE